jgi:hypothetical protein
MAYASLGQTYANLGETSLASENTKKACVEKSRSPAMIGQTISHHLILENHLASVL